MKNSILLLFSIIAIQISAQNLDSTNLRTRSWAIFTDLGINSLSEFNLGFEYFIKKNRSLDWSVSLKHPFFGASNTVFCHLSYFALRNGLNLKMRYNYYKNGKNWFWVLSAGGYLGYHYLKNHRVSCNGYPYGYTVNEKVYTLGGMVRAALNHQKNPYISGYINLGVRGGMLDWAVNVGPSFNRKWSFTGYPIFDFGIRCQFVKFKKMKN